MLIVNQDRDDIIVKTEALHTLPRFKKSFITKQPYVFGLNLYHGETLLGTFDSVKEATDEMMRIDSSEDAICFVGGYGQRQDARIVRLLLAELQEAGYAVP